MRDLRVGLEYRTYVAILICDEDIEDRFLLALTFAAEVCLCQITHTQQWQPTQA